MDFQDFKDAYQKVPIGHYPNNVPDDPVVSVCVQTYQHVDYIEDCLEGILMQETDFTYEILLGEDASTDGTREICIKYAQKYPDKIRLFLHERENNITIAGQPTGRFNFLYNLYSAKGKYIALCEGDDYWTDPLKLQKQVEFMEEHQNCSLCFHPSKVIYGNSKRLDQVVHQYNNLKSQVFQPTELLSGKVNGWTASLLFRLNVVKSLPKWFASVRYGDVTIKMLCAAHGDIGYVGGNAMSVYRRGTEGAWSGQEGKSREWEERRLKDHLQLIEYFNEFTDHKFEKSLTEKKYKHIMNYLLAVQPHISKLDQAKLLTRHFDVILFKPKKFAKVLIQFAFGQDMYRFFQRCRRA